jgi:hypothetical protein
MDFMTNEITPPKKTKGDYVYDVAKAAVGTIPVAGSLLSGFIETVIVPPYQKKNEEFMQSIVDSIEEIQSKIDGFNVNDLKDNATFQDAMFITTKSAMATSSDIKRKCLLNALQNIALNKSPNQITSAIFLNFIDRFNEGHIRICRILEAPNDYRIVKGEYETKETYRELINKTLPDIGSAEVNIIVRELHDNELISLNADRIDDLPQLFKEGESKLTRFGKQFIDFIKNLCIPIGTNAYSSMKSNTNSGVNRTVIPELRER